MDENSKQLNNISALLEYGVDPKTLQPWFSFAALTNLLTVRVNGLVFMGFSRAWVDRFSDDSAVMEVRCEYRQPSVEELRSYAWPVDSASDLPKLTIISIEGHLCLKIICESYDIAVESLSRKFPDMV